MFNLVDGVLVEASADDIQEMQDRVAAVKKAEKEAIHASMSAYIGTVRELRERILNRLAGIATAAMVSEDQATVDAFMLARQRLLDITKIPGAVAATNTAELEAAIKAEYAAILGSVPASIKTAFDKVDQ
jgi:hypothetical protein